MIILVAIAGFWIKSHEKLVIPTELKGVLYPKTKSYSPFNLLNQHKKPFTLDNLKDKWSFVFFGYTHCPDICPTSMQDLKILLKKLKENHASLSQNTQVIFVSVDPKRDTPEHLLKYVSYFNKDFIALTGSKKEIDKFTLQTGGGYYIEPTQNTENYQVNHTASFFLIDPKMQVRAKFSQPHIIENLVSQYVMIRNLLD
jgi:protein SCO1/2